MTWYRHKDRPLTPDKEALHARHLCVACGQPVPRIRRKAAADVYPLECAACAQQGERVPAARGYGAARASMHHEYCRRLGYSAGATGAPESGEDDE